MSKLVYVSWNDCGSSVCVEKPLKAAADANAELLFLAVLDTKDFVDIKKSQLLLAVDELQRLLTAQIRVAAKRINLEDVPFSVLVRMGDKGMTCDNLLELDPEDRVMFEQNASADRPVAA